jgi:hypothetical protein
MMMISFSQVGVFSFKLKVHFFRELILNNCFLGLERLIKEVNRNSSVI